MDNRLPPPTWPLHGARALYCTSYGEISPATSDLLRITVKHMNKLKIVLVSLERVTKDPVRIWMFLSGNEASVDVKRLFLTQSLHLQACRGSTRWHSSHELPFPFHFFTKQKPYFPNFAKVQLRYSGVKLWFTWNLVLWYLPYVTLRLLFFFFTFIFFLSWLVPKHSILCFFQSLSCIFIWRELIT